MRVALVVTCVLVAGCGRLGFDLFGDDEPPTSDAVATQSTHGHAVALNVTPGSTEVRATHPTRTVSVEQVDVSGGTNVAVVVLRASD